MGNISGSILEFSECPTNYNDQLNSYFAIRLHATPKTHTLNH